MGFILASLRSSCLGICPMSSASSASSAECGLSVSAGREEGGTSRESARALRLAYWEGSFVQMSGGLGRGRRDWGMHLADRSTGAADSGESGEGTCASERR
jgi:hypothetical protein